jgi:thymidylate kinase
MKPYKLICITGPDGSGKSTLINELKNQLDGAVVTSIWDIMREPSLQNVVPFKTPQEVDNYLSCLHDTSRSLFLMHCLAESLAIAKTKEPQYILSDSYWYKYYATEIAHGTSKGELDKLISVFEEPNLIFYIDAKETLTLERKEHFSNYECGFAKERNKQSFMLFQQKAIQNIQKLMDSVKHKILNPNLSVSENLETVLHQLKPETI